MTRKILYSPGFGAGWITWNDDELAYKLLTYQPIIDFLENGGNSEDLKKDHPIIKCLEKECKEDFGTDYVCVLGADSLRIAEVNGEVKIEEYDGYERYITRDTDTGWL
jgi:hypothetical protein